MSRLRIFVTIVLVVGLWGPAAAAQLVVIASTAPNLRPGTIINGAKSIKLSPGATVTLISSEGKTMKLSGPYEGQPDSSSSTKSNDLLQSLSRLVAGPPENDPSLAVFRSGAGSTRPDVWSINVGRSGVYCVPPDKAVALWRAKARKKTVLTLKRIGGQGGETKRDWPAGEQRMSWPAEVPLSNGATYQAQLKGQGKSMNFRLIFVPENLPTHAHRAAWMADNDCSRQALRLIDALAQTAR
jgi:hypothetical protein